MSRAVVCGASLSGLLAARALSDYYSTVTVVERDALPTEPGPRRGVPQAEHNHLLLARGKRELEEMFPGVTAELHETGAPGSAMLRQTQMFFGGNELARGDADMTVILASRALLEHTLRTRVAALPGVEFVTGCEASRIEVDDDRVAGARITHLGDEPREETLAADIVVDAMGRGGRSTTWLSELGYPAPDEDRLKCDVMYVSRFIRMPAGVLGSDNFVFVGAAPGSPKLLGLSYLEGDRWIVTAGGVAGVRPPTDDAGFLSFIDTLPAVEASKALRNAETLSPLVSHRYPASVRRRYDRLARVPDGLLVMGDALCSFNPIYGQGMTVAAMQAQALRDILASGRDGLTRRYFKAATKVLDVPWNLSTGGDLSLPEVEGKRSPATRMITRYLAKVHRAAGHNAEVGATFLRVAGMVEPMGAIMKPGFMAKVFFSRP